MIEWTARARNSYYLKASTVKSLTCSTSTCTCTVVWRVKKKIVLGSRVSEQIITDKFESSIYFNHHLARLVNARVHDPSSSTRTLRSPTWPPSTYQKLSLFSGQLDLESNHPLSGVPGGGLPSFIRGDCPNLRGQYYPSYHFLPNPCIEYTVSE